MSTFTNYLEDLVLNVFRGNNITAPTTVYAALFSAAPTDAGGGTELSTAGYARQAVTFGAPSGGQIANDAEVSWQPSGGDWTVVAVGYFDAASAGNLLAYDTFASETITDGNIVRLQTGAATIAID